MEEGGGERDRDREQKRTQEREQAQARDWQKENLCIYETHTASHCVLLCATPCCCAARDGGGCVVWYVESDAGGVMGEGDKHGVPLFFGCVA